MIVDRLLLNERAHIIHRAFRDTENARHDALWVCESCNTDAITDRQELDPGFSVVQGLLGEDYVRCTRCFGYPGERDTTGD